MSARAVRGLGIVLFAIALLFVPLVVLGERLKEPTTELGLYLYAAWIFAPFVAFAGLLLLVETSVRRVQPDEKTRWTVRALMWGLGPLGCLIAIFRLTGPEGSGSGRSDRR